MNGRARYKSPDNRNISQMLVTVVTGHWSPGHHKTVQHPSYQSQSPAHYYFIAPDTGNIYISDMTKIRMHIIKLQDVPLASKNSVNFLENQSPDLGINEKKLVK